MPTVQPPESVALPPGSAPWLDDRFEADDWVEAVLADDLLRRRSSADLGQVLLAVLAVAVFWTEAPQQRLLTWAGLLAGAALVRHFLRRAILSEWDSADRRLTVARADAALSAALWIPLPVMLAGASVGALAMLLVCYSGLVSAATSTLGADRRAFLAFTGTLIVPLVAALLASHPTRDHVSMVGLTALFVPFMAVVHGRAHNVLRRDLEGRQERRRDAASSMRRMAFLDTLVEHNPTSVTVLDEFGRVLHANPAFAALSGASPQDLEGRKLTDLVTSSIGEERVRAFLEGLEPGVTSSAQIELPRADGDRIWLQLTGTRSGEGASAITIVNGIDVSQHVEGRQALERANEEAEAVARAKASFLASMSHEIRTPMNGILGMLGLLAETPLTNDQRESVEIVQRSADALLGILNDILDVSKIEAGQLDLEEIGFDVAQLVTETARVFTPQAWTREVELLLDIAPLERSFVVGDPLRLRQVLGNLLSNAVKFTSQGEVILSVQPCGPTVDDPAGSRVRFAVTDTGEGIAPEKQGAIFAEFEQADQSTTRTHGGTGLGLTISRRLVELMGGSLLVESTLGEGSTFWFEVPLPPARDRRNSERAPVRVDLTGRRFLVVDDNDTARRILLAVLSSESAKVDEAATVERALQLMWWATDKGTPYDGVVVDHLMPGQDGFALARKAREDERTRQTPILMLTSSGDVAGRQEARALGIGGYLAKPVGRPDLVRATAELIGNAAYEGPQRRLVTDASLPRTRRLRILVAEDNTVNQHVIKVMLTKLGHSVEIVGNGRLAVDAVMTEPYDIVLMDIQMPVMDGRQATREIRARKQFAALPIVAVTAHVFTEERELCFEAGMSDFLPKPIKPPELEGMLEKWAPSPATVDASARAPASGDQVPSADPAGAAVPDVESTTARPSTASRDGSGPERAPGASGDVRLSGTEKAPTANGGAPPVDVDAFRAVMRDAGIEEVVEAALELYLRDTPAIFESLRDAASVRDAEGVRHTAHLLKGSSANIRADGFAGLLTRLEVAGANGSETEISALMPSVEDAYDAVMRHLTATVGA